MRTHRFFPNQEIVSVFAILLGILIIIIPNILEYVIAIILIVSGAFGILSGRR